MESACQEWSDDGDTPRKRRLNPARRALALLASSPHGTTKRLLVAVHGFDTDMIADLVRAGLAAEEREVMKAGAKTIDVVRVRITEGAEGDRKLG